MSEYIAIDSRSQRPAGGEVTHLRFVEELDRDTDRGSELAHFGECVTGIRESSRPKEGELNHRKLSSQTGNKWSEEVVDGGTGDAERGEFCG